MSAKSNVFAPGQKTCNLRCDERLEVIGDSLFDAPDLLGWLSEKTIGEMLKYLAPAGRLMARGEVAHRFVQVVLIEQQAVHVFQSHVGADLAQRFQGVGDTDLRLVSEKALVAGVAETGSGIDDCLCEGIIGDTPVGSEIVGVAWSP
jgi:hypothetical protein